ncbi:MAG TPA: hypothetical protein VMY41_10290, partial [Thermohalobaculum sp.]|nr:hypothetical protein [Thermohalobaculum sp.]
SRNCGHRLILRRRDAPVCHALQPKPRERCVLITTKSTLSGVPRSILAHGELFSHRRRLSLVRKTEMAQTAVWLPVHMGYVGLTGFSQPESWVVAVQSRLQFLRLTWTTPQNARTEYYPIFRKQQCLWAMVGRLTCGGNCFGMLRWRRGSPTL